MKTIEEASLENSKNHYIMAFSDELHKDADMDFRAGVEFSQRWIPVAEELPVCYEDGVWDGLRSEFMSVRDSFGEWHKARLYSGVMDGHEFNDWYDERDYELRDVTHWRYIELK